MSLTEMNSSTKREKTLLSLEEEQTLDYYKNNAASFAAQTQEVNFSSTQDRFLSLLPRGGSILDFGCGAGRDSKYFLEAGYHVEAWDGCQALCEMAQRYTGLSVKCKLFQELCAVSEYDGIWACSSILHLKKPELRKVFWAMSKALKEEGILYTSFKYGEFEGVRSGRYFTCFTQEGFASFLEEAWELKIVEEWISSDIRPGRGEEKWLNLMIKKNR